MCSCEGVDRCVQVKEWIDEHKYDASKQLQYLSKCFLRMRKKLDKYPIHCWRKVKQKRFHSRRNTELLRVGQNAIKTMAIT